MKCTKSRAEFLQIVFVLQLDQNVSLTRSRRNLDLFTVMALVNVSGPTRECGALLVNKLSKHGYVYVKHNLMSPDVLKKVKVRGRELFTKVLPQFHVEERSLLETTNGFRGLYRYVGASGRDDSIDCFSIGREARNLPQDYSVEGQKRDEKFLASLRSPYYELAGWEKHEYLPLITRSNPWPDGAVRARGNTELLNECEEFRMCMTDYYQRCNTVAMDVLRCIACALGIQAVNPREAVPSPSKEEDVEYFVRYHDKQDHNLEVKFYPHIGSVLRKPLVPVQLQGSHSKAPRMLRRKSASASPATDDIVFRASTSGKEASKDDSEFVTRLDSHKDLSTLTILAQDALGGLEVFDDAAEAFLPIPVLEDAVVVQAGRFLELWTGGLIEATPHRVRSSAKGPVDDRCSIVFFCFPNHCAKIEPLVQAEDNPVLSESDWFFAGDKMPPR